MFEKFWWTVSLKEKKSYLLNIDDADNWRKEFCGETRERGQRPFAASLKTNPKWWVKTFSGWILQQTESGLGTWILGWTMWEWLGPTAFKMRIMETTDVRNFVNSGRPCVLTRQWAHYSLGSEESPFKSWNMTIGLVDVGHLANFDHHDWTIISKDDDLIMKPVTQ